MQKSGQKPKLTFDQTDVEVEHKEPLYSGFLSTSRLRLRHRLFDGGWSAWIDRELMERGHAVAVLPYDPNRDEIVLIEQFRVGAMATSESPWLFELVAGMVADQDDDWADVARRELEEEAGLQAQHLHFAMSYLSSPGGMSERVYVYIAEVDSRSASELGGVADENEDIRVHVCARTEVEAMLAEGKIDNAVSVIALQWLQLHRHKLFAQKKD
ncbi:MAG: ADP-ribose diphosphatase [Idiomarina sp.]